VTQRLDGSGRARGSGAICTHHFVLLDPTVLNPPPCNSSTHPQAGQVTLTGSAKRSLRVSQAASWPQQQPAACWCGKNRRVCRTWRGKL